MTFVEILNDFEAALHQLTKPALSEPLEDNFRVLVPFICAYPHLTKVKINKHEVVRGSFVLHTFRNVLRPARILPPIQVVYLRSAGAEMRIFISSTASRLISRINRSGKFLHRVEPPESTMLWYSALRRSRSVRVIASWTI